MSAKPTDAPDLALMDRLTAILAAPLPSLIIGDPRLQADILQGRLVDLKLAATIRLQAEVEKIPYKEPRR